MFSSSSPNHPAPTLSHSPSHFPSNAPLCLLNVGRIHRPRLFTRATSTLVVEKSHLYARKCAGKLTVGEFLEALPSSQRFEDVEILRKSGGFKSIIAVNHMLTSLIGANEVEIALKLKSCISSFGFAPDIWTYSILISFYCKLNEPLEAKNILNLMLGDGFEPDVATFTTLINSFCKVGRMQDALQVFDVMSEIGCPPTIFTYNCLLKGLCYVGKVEEAYDLLNNIKNSVVELELDIYSYTAVMNGFCKVGRSKEAMELMDEALEVGLNPNVVTYNTLFNGYFKEGRPLSGISLLRQMKERNCSPDSISYSTLLHGLIKWGEVREALAIYREMVEIGFRADERMMNTLLRGLCRRSRKEPDFLKDVKFVFQELKNGDYTICPRAYDLMVEVLYNGEETEKAFMVLNEMVAIGYSPRTFTFNIVIRSLCGVGDVDKALSVLMLLHSNKMYRGFPYTTLINELNREQRSFEACSVYGAALKRGMLPKIKNLSRTRTI